MLYSEAIDQRTVTYQGKSVSIKDYFRELKRREEQISIRPQAIDFCKSQYAPDNSWGIWYSIIETCCELGLSNREMLQVILRQGTWGATIYCGGLRDLFMKMVNDAPLAEEYCNEVLTDPKFRSRYYSPNEGLVILVNHKRPIEKYTSLISLDMTADDLRTVLNALSTEDRRKVLVELFSHDRLVNDQGKINPRVVLLYAAPIADLLVPEVESVIAAQIVELEKNKGTTPEEVERAEKFIQSVKTKTPLLELRDASGMTPDAASTVAYLQEAAQKRQRLAGFDNLVESLRDRHVVVSAKELYSLNTWKAASAERRQSIVKELEKQVTGLKFVRFSETEWSIAEFKHTPSKQTFSLVPGGEYDRGLSEPEEQLLKAYLQNPKNKLAEEDHEILKLIEHMRPVRKVQINPLLAAQKVSCKGDVSELMDWLEATPFRLPSEAEWEWLARGAKSHELTWTGHVIPDKKWMKDVKKQFNAFQLREFGLHAEVCTDVWLPMHQATDDKPVLGKGPRACRGGAAELAPWQNTGEWHLLCTAHRYSSESMLLLAGRAVMGIRIEEV